MVNMDRFKINKRLLNIKGHYFLFNAGTAPVIPFLSLYAKQLGFSSLIVGIIYTVLPISGMLAKPVAGAIADRFYCQKLIFLLAGLLVAGGFTSIYFVPAVPKEKIVHFSCDGTAVFDNCISDKILENLDLHPSAALVTCELNCPIDEDKWHIIESNWIHNNVTRSSKMLNFEAIVPLDRADLIGDCAYFKINKILYKEQEVTSPCPKEQLTSICEINCNNDDVNDVVTVPTFKDDDVLKTHQFWLFLLLMTISWIAMAIVVSVGDTICFELLGDKPSNYGAQRCWGALGWGILIIITGVIVDHVSQGKKEKDYAPAFIIAVVILLLNFICCYFIKYKQQVYESSILKGIGKLLKDIKILVFICWCMFVGLCTGLMWNFYLWLVEERASEMENHLEWISTLQGLLLATQTLIGELPFFWLSGIVLKKIGHVHAMSLVLLVFGIRFILYSTIENPWFYIPIEVCSGLTFGIFYATMTSYACLIAPPGAATTIQGLVGAIFEGVGVSLGSLIAGALMKRSGGPLTFMCFGVASLIACLIHFTVQFFLRKKTNEEDLAVRYATPNDALGMLTDDAQEMQLIN